MFFFFVRYFMQKQSVSNSGKPNARLAEFSKRVKKMKTVIQPPPPQNTL